MNVTEYRTVSAISSKELDHAVNRQLKLGFQPFGSPYVAGTGSNQSIFQALVKFESASGEVNPAVETRVPHLLKEG